MTTAARIDDLLVTAIRLATPPVVGAWAFGTVIVSALPVLVVVAGAVALDAACAVHDGTVSR